MTASVSGQEAKTLDGSAQHANTLSRGQALALLVLTNTLWAGTYAAGKIALRYLTPIELNAIRFTIATIALSPVLISQWRRIPRDRHTVLTLVALSLIGFVFNKAFEYFGLALSTASDVALLIATESLFTALISWTLLRERVTRSGVLALVVGMAGVYLIVERGVAPNLGGAGVNQGARIIGDLLVILSLLLESGYTVLGKRVIVEMPPLLFMTVTLVGSLFIWLPAGAVAVAQTGWPHVPLEGWLAVLYMALVATGIGYWLWFRALRALDASVAAPTLFIQPLLGVGLAVWLVGDTLTWATIAGGALICVSLVLVMRRGRRSEPTTALAALDELGESTP